MSQFFECLDDRKMSFLLSCDHRVHVEDAVKLIHFKLCPMCHRILKMADVLVLVEYLREQGFFYETGQEAKVCEMNGESFHIFLGAYAPTSVSQKTWGLVCFFLQIEDGILLGGYKRQMHVPGSFRLQQPSLETCVQLIL
ncbi:hypothetical protein AVEN_215324-1 [Araneus ventricosus]|uniref:Uncharacterized protein n=1 Tax=Araneus ventricosus TaxID=182803 RepID=A0A4Y2U098_ARAVE|nr:hypothetical protein AVEN_215324-1 [Araneus ventricosus]